MLVTLATPYADTTAADLSFGWGLPAQPALHVLRLPASGGVTVELRLLGASHQVRLSHGGDQISETVACLSGRVPALPSTVDHDGYRFTARVHRLTDAAFAHRVADLRTAASADPYSMVGVFPGSPQAVTVLTATPHAAGIGWRSWHAYPQSGELVETATEVLL